jgi:hypothetical protein
MPLALGTYSNCAKDPCVDFLANSSKIFLKIEKSLYFFIFLTFLGVPLLSWSWKVRVSKWGSIKLSLEHVCKISGGSGD